MLSFVRCVIGLSAAAALCATVGCAALDPGPAEGLAPPAMERLRSLIGRVPDERLRSELTNQADVLQAAWPVRLGEASRFTARPLPPSEPTPVAALRDKLTVVSDAELRRDMLIQTELLEQQWRTGNRDGSRPVGWFLQAESVRVDAFTNFKTAEDGQIYLEARVQAIDVDGHPLRTVGKFRLELFRVERGAPDPRGPRVGLWNIDIQTHDDNRRYYDQLINGYTFPLDLEGAVPSLADTRYILEATFIRPDGARVYPSNFRYVEGPIDDEAAAASTTGTTATAARPGARRPSTSRLRNTALTPGLP